LNIDLAHVGSGGKVDVAVIIEDIECPVIDHTSEGDVAVILGYTLLTR
jgi:hypothetical protein